MYVEEVLCGLQFVVKTTIYQNANLGDLVPLRKHAYSNI